MFFTDFSVHIVFYRLFFHAGAFDSDGNQAGGRKFENPVLYGKKPDTDKGDSAKADCAQTGDADGNGLAAPFSLYAACELEAESTFPRYHGKYSAKIRRRIQSVRAVLLPALFCSHLQNEHLNKQHFNRNHVKRSILDGIFRKNGFLFRGIGQRCKETT